MFQIFNKGEENERGKVESENSFKIFFYWRGD